MSHIVHIILESWNVHTVYSMILSYNTSQWLKQIKESSRERNLTYKQMKFHQMCVPTSLATGDLLDAIIDADSKEHVHVRSCSTHCQHHVSHESFVLHKQFSLELKRTCAVTACRTHTDSLLKDYKTCTYLQVLHSV